MRRQWLPLLVTLASIAAAACESSAELANPWAGTAAGRTLAAPPSTTTTTTTTTTTLASTPTSATSAPTTSAPPVTTVAPTTTAAPATAAPTATATARAVRLAAPRGPALVVQARRPAALALATSRALFASSPAVVIVGSLEAIPVAAPMVHDLGIPMLLVTSRPILPAVAAEVERLRARWVLAVGPVPRRLRRSLGHRVTVVRDSSDLPAFARAAPARGVAALVVRDDRTVAAAVATARAARLPVVGVEGGDPRVSRRSREALRRLAPARVVAIGKPGAFARPLVLAGLVRTAVRGAELPGGGQVLFPRRRLVALYGHPGDANLGALGEQPVAAAARRARRVARPHHGLGGKRAVATFEIITTVASSEPGRDGDYSLESSLDHIRPWVDAAAEAGMYVVLDLQPGRSHFLDQARRYRKLLREPHVGLALDPEWRLRRRQRHLRDIGQVSAREVNQVAAWLAELTRRRGLPQKLLLLHQFRLAMLPDREAIKTHHRELALVVQMDGFGSQQLKLNTWHAITDGGPAGLRFGWKNFYDEDTTLRSPADTAALRPSPVFVSYQ